MLAEIVSGHNQPDPYAAHGEDDLVLDDDDYDHPAPPLPKKKKAVKKKKAPTSAAFAGTELAPVAALPIQPSPTAFALPPSSSSTAAGGPSSAAAASAHAKKYLNNVTTYFNEKRDQFGRGRGGGDGAGDPEVSGTMDDLALREAALKRREAEILAQEQKVAERERQVKQFEGHINNWPFKWWAILYHNIPEDILPENQLFIRMFYYLWSARTEVHPSRRSPPRAAEH